MSIETVAQQKAMLKLAKKYMGLTGRDRVVALTGVSHRQCLEIQPEVKETPTREESQRAMNSLCMEVQQVTDWTYELGALSEMDALAEDYRTLADTCHKAGRLYDAMTARWAEMSINRALGYAVKTSEECPYGIGLVDYPTPSSGYLRNSKR